MHLTEFLAQMQEVLDDPSAAKYPLATIVRNADQQLRGMFRVLLQTNHDYSNFTLCLQAEDAKQPIKGIFEYRLPSWVASIPKLYIRTESATSETSFSPYRWTEGQVSEGQEILKYGAVGSVKIPHWSWEGNGTIRIRNYSTAQELIARCAVRPPRLVKVQVATVSSDGDAQRSLYLPPTPVLGTYELEEGAYINSYWQVTTTSNVNATHYGDVRRCIYSSAVDTAEASTRQTRLWMDANWTNTLAANDVVETLIPLPDEHCRYLVLRTAQACFQKKNNLAGLKAIAGEMMGEQQAFADYAAPPKESAPRRRKTQSPFVRGMNVDRPYLYGYGWS